MKRNLPGSSQFYLGTTRLQLEHKGDSSHTFTSMANIVPAFGFLGIPIIGWLLDKKGYGVTMGTINFLGVLASLFEAMPSLGFQVLNPKNPKNLMLQSVPYLLVWVINDNLLRTASLLLVVLGFSITDQIEVIAPPVKMGNLLWWHAARSCLDILCSWLIARVSIDILYKTPLVISLAASLLWLSLS